MQKSLAKLQYLSLLLNHLYVFKHKYHALSQGFLPQPLQFSKILDILTEYSYLHIAYNLTFASIL